MKILVIGASGYLGNTIYRKLKENSNDEVYGTCCNSKVKELLQVNVLNKLDIRKVLSYKPDVIIWSVCDQENELCLSETSITEVVNSISSEVRLIYVSTTIGVGKNQTEDVKPHKRMTNEYLWKYINGKIEGERIVRTHSNHVIIRPGNIYGYNYSRKMDVRMKALLEASRAGKVYHRLANEYVSFVNVEDLSNAIIELIYTSFNGTINVAGEKPVSHYDFNVYLSKILNIDSSFIVPEYKKEENYHSLNSDKRKHIINTFIRDI